MFVFDPALERRGPRMPGLPGVYRGGIAGPGGAAAPGLVFSLFMACKMAGSQLYMIIGDRVPAATILRGFSWDPRRSQGAVAGRVLLVHAALRAFEFGLGARPAAVMRGARAELPAGDDDVGVWGAAERVGDKCLAFAGAQASRVS